MQNPDDITTTMKTVTAVLEQVIQMSHVVRKPVLPYANNKGAEHTAGADPGFLDQGFKLAEVGSFFAVWQFFPEIPHEMK